MKFFEEIYKLKTMVRTGWKDYNVEKYARGESNAEHCYCAIMLAIEIMNKKQEKLDELKIIKMLSFHEIGEIDFGDHTPFENIAKEQKHTEEHKCVKKIAKKHKMPEIEQLWLEFEEEKTKEAIFAKKMDKLSTIMQAKIYSEKCSNPELFKEFIKPNKLNKLKNTYAKVYEEFKEYF